MIGSNTTEAHPVISYYMKRAVKKGATLIVNDPRKIDLTRWATMHVQINPGSDVAYLNGLMREIIVNDWYDKDFVENHTEDFDELKKVVMGYTLEKTTKISGVPAETLQKVAKMLSEAETASLVYTLGITEHNLRYRQREKLRQLANVAGESRQICGWCQSATWTEQRPGRLRHGRAAQRIQQLSGCDRSQGAGEILQSLGCGICLTTKSARPCRRCSPAVSTGRRERAVYLRRERCVDRAEHRAHDRIVWKSARFVIVGEIFHNETTPYADVIFPDLAWGEEDGTFTQLRAPGQPGTRSVEAAGRGSFSLVGSQ